MAHSMTAFSRQQHDDDWGSLTWEIRSVNHRYLEPSIRLPDLFRGLENTVREALRKRLSRGKVECTLRYQFESREQSEIRLDTGLVRRLLNANTELEQITGKSTQLSSGELLRWPGVIQDEEFNTEEIEEAARALFITTLEDHIASRAREGEELKGFILQRLDSISAIVVDLREKMPAIIATQRQALVDRIQELKLELETGRLEQEATLLAQKADVDEELDRLDSHVKEVSRVMSMPGAKGRRLDFLMQELNREANTLSSKSIVAETTLDAVELKVLIEQMREQIQNIE